VPPELPGTPQACQKSTIAGIRCAKRSRQAPRASAQVRHGVGAEREGTNNVPVAAPVLPDLNVWLALSWANHRHSEAAWTWFSQRENDRFSFAGLRVGFENDRHLTFAYTIAYI
jgi:hypothetical protein